MWQEEIHVQGPYSFKRALRRLAADPLKVIDIEHETIQVPLVIEGKPIVVTIKNLGTLENPMFQIFSRSDKSDKEKAITKIRRIFHWDESLEKICEHFSKTALAPLFEHFRGTPLVLDFDLYYCLMKTIIHQQLNLKFAHKLTERFVKNFGFKVEEVWFPPSAEVVSELRYDDLRALQFSQRKAEYVIDTSKLIASGTLNLDDFQTKNDEEIIKTLVNIRGIGPWTAECLLLFGLGRKSIFPAADIGIQNGLKKFYGLEGKPTIEQMQKWRQEWAPYETYAALYLWEHVGNETANK